MKFHSVTDSVNPQKEAEREAVAKHVAEHLNDGGKVEHVPFGVMKTDAKDQQAFTISKPKVAKQAWKEGAV